MEKVLKVIYILIFSIILLIGYIFYQMYKSEKWRKDNNCVTISETLISHDSYFPYRKKYKQLMDCNGKRYYRFHN